MTAVVLALGLALPASVGARVHDPARGGPAKCGRWLVSRALATRHDPAAPLTIPPGCDQMQIPVGYDVRPGPMGTEVWLRQVRLATLPTPTPPPAVPLDVAVIDKRPLGNFPAQRRDRVAGMDVLFLD